MQLLLRSFASLREHRGGQPTALGTALASALGPRPWAPEKEEAEPQPGAKERAEQTEVATDVDADLTNESFEEVEAAAALEHVHAQEAVQQPKDDKPFYDDAAAAKKRVARPGKGKAVRSGGGSAAPLTKEAYYEKLAPIIHVYRSHRDQTVSGPEACLRLQALRSEIAAEGIGSCEYGMKLLLDLSNFISACTLPVETVVDASASHAGAGTGSSLCG